MKKRLIIATLTSIITNSHAQNIEMSLKVASSYLTLDGTIGAKGLNLQPTITVNFFKTPITKRLKLFYWSDYDIDTKKYL